MLDESAGTSPFFPYGSNGKSDCRIEVAH